VAAFLLAVLAVLVAAAPTAWRLRHQPVDAAGIVALATAVLFGLTSLSWVGTPNSPAPGLVRADVTHALWVVAVGLVAFGVGARLLGRVPRITLPEVPASRVLSARTLIAVYVCAALVLVAVLLVGRYGYLANPAAASTGSTQITSLGGMLAGLVVLTAIVTVFAGGVRQHWRALTALLVAQFALGFVAGVKGESVSPLIYLTLAFVAWRRRLPWRRILVVAVLVILVLLPLNRAYRKALRGAGTPVTAVAKVLTNPASYRPDTAVERAVAYLGLRFREIDFVALIVKRTPSEYPYADGVRYIQLPFIVLVPRAVWPGKPALDDSAQFSHTYAELQRNQETATQLTQIGDLYRNWGLLGVAAGMFVWGIVCGVWSRMLRRWMSPRFIAVHLFALITVFGYVESDLPIALATAAHTIPLAAFVAWCMLPGRGDSAPGLRRLAHFVRRLSRQPTQTSASL
jgi:hypothetical protein